MKVYTFSTENPRVKFIDYMRSKLCHLTTIVEVEDYLCLHLN